MSLHLLKRLRRQGKTAEILRQFDRGIAQRVIVRGMSEHYVHLLVIDGMGTFTHQSIIRREDIRLIRWGQEVVLSPASASYEMVGYIHLETLSGVLGSLDSKHIMATVYCETLNPVSSVTSRRFLVKEGMLLGEEINDLGQPCGYFGVNLADVTRLDFAGVNERRLEKLYAERALSVSA